MDKFGDKECHLFTNVLFCENCQKGMWYKANQKVYRCDGNIKYGDPFCLNRVVIREKELKHIILEDLQELFHSIQDDEFTQKIGSKEGFDFKRTNKNQK